MKPDVAYMIDTNILIDWACALSPRLCGNDKWFDAKTAGRIRQFMEENQNPVYIPDLVWSEFLGVFLQKDLDMSLDLPKLKLRFRDLSGLVDQIDNKILGKPELKRVSVLDAGFIRSPFAVADELARDIQILSDQNLLNWLKRKSNQHRKGMEKILDGIDSALIGYLYCLAEITPGQKIHFYTSDRRVEMFFSHIRNIHQNFPRNTGVFDARRPMQNLSGRPRPSHDLTLKNWTSPS